MRHPLSFLLRVGRSDDERVSLLGDLEEERRARLARGSGALVVFAWYTAEILQAFGWGIRDLVAPRTTNVAPRTRLRPAFAFAQATADRRRRSSFVSWPDIKLSLRLLVRSPGLTLVASIGLTVGIAIPTGVVGFFQANFDPRAAARRG